MDRNKTNPQWWGGVDDLYRGEDQRHSLSKGKSFCLVWTLQKDLNPPMKYPGGGVLCRRWKSEGLLFVGVYYSCAKPGQKGGGVLFGRSKSGPRGGGAIIWGEVLFGGKYYLGGVLFGGKYFWGGVMNA